jgi:hypothetical protein
MRTNSKQPPPSVKLFPRLAVSKKSRVHPPHRAMSRRHASSGAENDDSVETRRTQVRARLLRMILDNEEARRNDRRPSAS